MLKINKGETYLDNYDGYIIYKVKLKDSERFLDEASRLCTQLDNYKRFRQIIIQLDGEIYCFLIQGTDGKIILDFFLSKENFKETILYKPNKIIKYHNNS